jgi:ribosome-associated toxin RatA of RatAB toxin-antitoxin module
LWPWSGDKGFYRKVQRLIQLRPTLYCMKTVNKSVLIWYSAAEMFSLVTDVASYPQFLPWCNEASVIEEDAQGMTAKVGLAMAGLKQSFTTRNTHIKDRKVSLKLVDGPFSRLDGCWDFVAVGKAGERACKIEFTLRYDFDNAALAALVGPVFDKIAGSLVDAFVKRAGQVYGEI